jgi:hypothetical protein
VSNDADDISDGEGLFLAVLAFLLLKGLIDANDAGDRKRVEETWRRYKAPPKPPEPTLFQGLRDDLFG